MVGAYLGAQMAQVGADFWSSAIIGGLGAGLVGLILDRGLLRHLHRRFDDQVLVTFGAIFILTNVSRWIWGSWPKIGHLPEYLAGSFLVGDYSFPFHRVVLIGVGAMALLVVLGLQKKTHIGRAVRAGLDNKEMLMALGVRYEAIATGVFAFGAFMAGFAGYIASPMMGISLRLGLDALLLALVVVIVGGTGSVVGAFARGYAHRLRPHLHSRLLPRVCHVWCVVDLDPCPLAETFWNRVADKMTSFRSLRPLQAIERRGATWRWAAIGTLLLLPLVLPTHLESLATKILIFGLLASSLNLLYGYGGLFSLGTRGVFGNRGVHRRRSSGQIRRKQLLADSS